jgi:WD40 repeat protein
MTLLLEASPLELHQCSNGADEKAAIRRLHHGWQVLSVAWSRDGRWLVSGSADRTARLWNARTGAPERVLRGEC